MPDLNEQQIIETPKGLDKKRGTPDAMIFVMPQKYRGGSEKMINPTPPAPIAVAPAPRPAPPPPPMKKIPQPVKPERSSAKKMVVLGLIVLLILGGGGFYFLRSTNTPLPFGLDKLVQKPAPPVTMPPVTTPPVTTPPVTTPPAEEEPGTPFPGATVPGTDTDSDGLTDLEERQIYQTDPRLPDSDGDGFLDGNEVFNRYNPKGTAPLTLLESGLVKEYRPADNSYTIYYPSSWELEVGIEAPPTEKFEATTGEIVKLTVESKSPAMSLSAWYKTKSVTDGSLATVTKNGYPALVSANQLTQYIDLGSAVVALDYQTGSKGSIDYLQTFQMMINSLKAAK